MLILEGTACGGPVFGLRGDDAARAGIGGGIGGCIGGHGHRKGLARFHGVDQERAVPVGLCGYKGAEGGVCVDGGYQVGDGLCRAIGVVGGGHCCAIDGDADVADACGDISAGLCLGRGEVGRTGSDGKVTCSALDVGGQRDSCARCSCGDGESLGIDLLGNRLGHDFGLVVINGLGGDHVAIGADTKRHDIIVALGTGVVYGERMDLLLVPEAEQVLLGNCFADVLHGYGITHLAIFETATDDVTLVVGGVGFEVLDQLRFSRPSVRSPKGGVAHTLTVGTAYVNVIEESGAGDVDHSGLAILGGDDLDRVVVVGIPGEQVYPVELLLLDQGELLLQFLELVVVVFAIRAVLGDVIPEGLQLGHAVEDAAGDLLGAVLDLEEGNPVVEVVASRLSTAEYRAKLVVDGESAGIIGRSNNALAAREAVDALLKFLHGGPRIKRCGGGHRVGVDYDWHGVFLDFCRQRPCCLCPRLFRVSGSRLKPPCSNKQQVGSKNSTFRKNS